MEVRALPIFIQADAQNAVKSEKRKNVKRETKELVFFLCWTKE
jgi:hypothetical protein